MFDLQRVTNHVDSRRDSRNGHQKDQQKGQKDCRTGTAGQQKRKELGSIQISFRVQYKFFLIASNQRRMNGQPKATRNSDCAPTSLGTNATGYIFYKHM